MLKAIGVGDGAGLSSFLNMKFIISSRHKVHSAFYRIEISHSVKKILLVLRYSTLETMSENEGVKKCKNKTFANSILSVD